MGFIDNVKGKLLPTAEEKAERRRKEMQAIEKETERLREINTTKTQQVEALEARKRQQDLTRELKERERKSSRYYEPKQKLKASVINVAKNASSSSNLKLNTDVSNPPAASRTYTKTRSTKPKTGKSRKTSKKSPQPQTSPFSQWGDIGFNPDVYTGSSGKKKSQKPKEGFKLF